MRKSRNMAALLSIIVVSIPSATATAATRLHLLCTGSGMANATETITSQSEDSKGNSRSSSIDIDQQRPVQGEVEIEVIDGGGRILLPRALLPPVHGGKDGWFELRDVVETRDAIRAKAALSFMDRPNIQLNRLTGSLAIDGKIGSFSGRCRPYNLRAERVF